MNYEEIIDGYNDLRDKCYALARKDGGKLMGSDKWLRSALCESDMTLSFTSGGIDCYGSTYTTQTMSHESFFFMIPFSELEGE